ncbi:MAG: carboxypeptidase-like regulatory domain-containing protein [Pyrinomonadaceae bacterium]
MRKLFIVSLIIAATFAVGYAQGGNPSQNPDEPQNMGIAPKAPNGIGRADVRVYDEGGNPIRNALVKLESNRSDGYFCETDWGLTNDRGVMVLPPLHLGELKFKVKAKGYRSQELNIPASSLNEPVRVTLVRK